eukprot:396207-Prymnesium_polylepis.1
MVRGDVSLGLACALACATMCALSDERDVDSSLKATVGAVARGVGEAALINVERVLGDKPVEQLRARAVPGIHGAVCAGSGGTAA